MSIALKLANKKRRQVPTKPKSLALRRVFLKGEPDCLTPVLLPVTAKI